MFSRAKPGSVLKPLKRGAPGLSFIGEEVVVSGDVCTSAQLHIDGRIDGHVRCFVLSQGPSGVVSGDIQAEEVRIGGLVEGAIIAANVTLEATARITGDISYQTISIAAGAQVDGRLDRREALGSAAETLEVPSILTATPIGEPVIEPIKPSAPSQKSPRKGDRSAKVEPTLSDDIFSLTPPSQGAH
jgi:cytoskeletal protein CcmA (bactofilin family)